MDPAHHLMPHSNWSRKLRKIIFFFIRPMNQKNNNGACFRLTGRNQREMMAREPKSYSYAVYIQCEVHCIMSGIFLCAQMRRTKKIVGTTFVENLMLSNFGLLQFLDTTHIYTDESKKRIEGTDVHFSGETRELEVETSGMSFRTPFPTYPQREDLGSNFSEQNVCITGLVQKIKNYSLQVTRYILFSS